VIRIDGTELELMQHESVLDGLLRNGITPPYSCRSGVCQTCMMRAVKGKPTEQSQKNLRPARKKQNYFLACSCIPQEDMEIAFADSRLFRTTATIIDREKLCETVLRLRLTVPNSYLYSAGQYTTLYKNSTIGRSFSLASVPHLDDYLEFHIKLLPAGQISQWLLSETITGSSIMLGEALGNCMYMQEDPHQPIALIATGTGLSSIYGVLRDALHKRHQGEIRLYHGVGTAAELYLVEELQQLSDQHDNFEYFACLSRDLSVASYRQGRASTIAIEDIGNFSGWRVYLCGNPDMVKITQRQVFLAGASLNEIYADPFYYS